MPRGRDQRLAHVVEREIGRLARGDALEHHRAIDEARMAVGQLQLGDVAVTHHVQAVVGDAVADHVQQEELAADAGDVAAEAAVLEVAAPQADQLALLLGLAQAGALAPVVQAMNGSHSRAILAPPQAGAGYRM